MLVNLGWIHTGLTYGRKQNGKKKINVNFDD